MKREVSALVVEALSNIVPLLSLRGADEFAREGGDLDFMVPPGKALLACRRVAQVAIPKGWFLALFRDIGYLAQIVLVRPKKDGSNDAIKIDFFDGLRWYGVGSDRAGLHLFDVILPESASKERLAGAAGYFQKILTVGQASERDWARVAATGADLSYLTKIAGELRLPITAAAFAQHGVTGIAKWRLRAASGGVVGPKSTLIWFVRVLAAHIRFKMGTGTCAGMALFISGLDRSSKRTLVDRLLEIYRKAGGEQPKVVHLVLPWTPVYCSRANGIYLKSICSSRINGVLRILYYIPRLMTMRLALWIRVKSGGQTFVDCDYRENSKKTVRPSTPLCKLSGWLARLFITTRGHFYVETSQDMLAAKEQASSPQKLVPLAYVCDDVFTLVSANILHGDNLNNDMIVKLLTHISREYTDRIGVALADVDRFKLDVRS